MRREHQLDKCGGGRCKCWPLEAVTSVVSGRVYSLPDKISLSHCSCHKLLAISFTAVLTCTTHTQFFLQCLSFQSDHFSFLLSLFRSFILPFALPSLFISFRFFWCSFSSTLAIILARTEHCPIQFELPFLSSSPVLSYHRQSNQPFALKCRFCQL